MSEKSTTLVFSTEVFFHLYARSHIPQRIIIIIIIIIIILLKCHQGAFVTWSPDGGRSSFSLTSPSIYPQGKRVMYPMATRLGSPQNVSKSGNEADDCPSLESNSSRLARKDSLYGFKIFWLPTTATTTTTSTTTTTTIDKL